MNILRWFVGITFAVGFFLIIAGSPIHRYSDYIFWFMTANTFGLVFLSVVLHNESKKEERTSWIRVFILADWLLVLGMACASIWRSIRAGTFW